MIFQPTNITPSTFAGIGGGTVAAQDTLSISWQVNGNSPLKGFYFEIQENTFDSTLVYGEKVSLVNSPFYGTDNKGNPQIYTYTDSNTTWSNIGLVDGKSYKLLITQYWGNVTWNGSSFVGGESIVQYSPSVFITRTAPTISIDNFESTVTGITQNFSATYSQAQGDSINWCKWQLARVNENGSYTELENTGEVNTGILSFTADGLFSGNTYAIMCTVETQNGVIASTGWNEFDVSYAEEATAQPIVPICKNDSSVLIGFGELTTINAQTSSDNYGEISNGSLIVNRNEFVKWDQTSFSEPYSFLWKGDVTGFQKFYQDNDFSNVYGMDVYVTQTGSTYLFVSGENKKQNPVLRSYEKQNDGSFSKIGSDYALSGMVLLSNSMVSCNPAGTLVCVCASNAVWVFRLSNGIVSNPIVLTNNGTGFTENSLINYAKFSSDGTVLIVGGQFGTNVYKVSGTSVSFGSKVTYTENNVTYDYKTSSMATLSINGVSNVILGSAAGGAFATLYSVAADKTLTKLDTLILARDPYTPTTTMNFCENIVFENRPAAAPYVLIGGIYTWGNTITEKLQNASNCFELYTINSSQFGIGTPLAQDPDKLLSVQPNSWKVVQRSVNSTLLSDGIGIYAFDQSNGSLAFLYNLKETSFDNAVYNSPCVFYPTQTNDVIGFVVGSFGVFAFEKNLNSNQIAISVGYENGDSLDFSIGLFSIIGKFGINREILIRGNTAIICVSYSDSSTARLDVVFYNNNQKTLSETLENIYSPSYTITNITLNGYLETEYFYVKSGGNLYQSIETVPSVSDDTYFLTNFSENTLNAQSYAGLGSESYLYRSDNGILQRIYTVNSSVYLIKDFGLKSGKKYTYEVVTKNSNGDYTPVTVSNEICLTYRAYFLIEATQDTQNPNVYHALKVWAFGSNINAGAVSNNNTPTWLTNFTPYRFRQPTARAGKSGTLQALLSNVDPNSISYTDTAQMQADLYNASLSQNVFFLKDTKGNLYMVHISSPITQTINTKSNIQEVTVSVPWEEIGDASAISLIQIPTDTGWEG